MAEFSIHPLRRFESSSTSIKRPRHFLEFSFDREHKIQLLSDQSLRYYYPPFIDVAGVERRPINLTNGFANWERSDDSIDGHLDGLVQTLQAHEEQLLQDGNRIEDVRVKADVVTWRGMMTKILTAAFDMYGDFEMNATFYQGTIFIEENHSYALADKTNQNARPPRRGEMSQEMMQYCGYKFEALSVLSRPWAEATRDEIDSRDNEIVNNNEQYCSIVRTSIGGNTLVLAGEVDCLLGAKPDDPDDPHPWVELKTTAEPTSNHPREMQKYERKLLKYWAQSFLLGVPKIMVGFRTRDGYLSRIDELETQKIPGSVLRAEGMWNGNVCINLTATFLAFLKETIMNTDGVWRIKREKNDPNIRIFKVEDSGTGRILEPGFKAHRDRLFAKEIASKLGSPRMSISRADDGSPS